MSMKPSPPGWLLGSNWLTNIYKYQNSAEMSLTLGVGDLAKK